ncbi:MAG: rRNA maturation RNase YbeY [Candidatus Neomarinimicrobiota bacterium]
MPSVKIINDHNRYFLLRPAVERIAYFVANQERKYIKNVTLIVTDDQTLNEMKINFFGADLLTDTISFNFNEPGEPIEGEIYLSLDRILENSRTFKVPFEKEIALVIIHSLLHLLGYDDENLNNKKQMLALQNFYIQRVELVHLYRTRKIPPAHE